jgi:hypothetical protein
MGCLPETLFMSKTPLRAPSRRFQSISFDALLFEAGNTASGKVSQGFLRAATDDVCLFIMMVLRDEARIDAASVRVKSDNEEDDDFDPCPEHAVYGAIA